MAMDGQTKKEPPSRELVDLVNRNAYFEEELKRKLSSIDITLTYLNGTFWDLIQLVERLIVLAVIAVLLLVGLVVYESGFSM